jgi:hypothetical protein
MTCVSCREFTARDPGPSQLASSSDRAREVIPVSLVLRTLEPSRSGSLLLRRQRSRGANPRPRRTSWRGGQIVLVAAPTRSFPPWRWATWFPVEPIGELGFAATRLQQVMNRHDLRRGAGFTAALGSKPKTTEGFRGRPRWPPWSFAEKTLGLIALSGCRRTKRTMSAKAGRLRLIAQRRRGLKALQNATGPTVE